MARLVVGVEIAAPAMLVFRELADWVGQERWIPSTVVRIVAGDGKIGSTIVARSAVGPIGFDDTMVVTRFQPHELIDVRHEGWLVRGPARFRVIELGDGRCKVIVAEDLRAPAGILGEVGWLFVKPLARDGLRRALHQFRTIVESDALGV